MRVGTDALIERERWQDLVRLLSYNEPTTCPHRVYTPIGKTENDRVVGRARGTSGGVRVLGGYVRLTRL